MSSITTADLAASRGQWGALLDEVGRLETPLSGGRKLKAGEIERRLRRLADFQVAFGDPRARLVKLTTPMLKELGQTLDAGLRQQLREKFDLHFLSLPVNLRPARGASFWRVECELTFRSLAGPDPIVHSQFPRGEWQPVLEWGGHFTLALDAGLNWGVETPGGVPAQLGELPMVLQPRVAGQNGLAGFIRVGDFSFTLGRAAVIAEGQGSPRVSWRLEGQTVKRAQDLYFGVILKVPKGVTQLVVEGVVQADPEFDWLVTNLQNVWDGLGQSVQTLLARPPAERRAAERLLCGAGERWDVALD